MATELIQTREKFHSHTGQLPFFTTLKEHFNTVHKPIRNMFTPFP